MTKSDSILPFVIIPIGFMAACSPCDPDVFSFDSLCPAPQPQPILDVGYFPPVDAGFFPDSGNSPDVGHFPFLDAGQPFQDTGHFPFLDAGQPSQDIGHLPFLDAGQPFPQPDVGPVSRLCEGNIENGDLTNCPVDVSRGLVSINEHLAIQTSRTIGINAPNAGLIPTNYVGAIDPNATSAWWSDWTYTSSTVAGSLPSINSSSHHPLEDNITNGSLRASTSHRCSEINTHFSNGGFVSVFGQNFPVCVISRDITQSTRLSNDHVYVLNGLIRVGNGHNSAATISFISVHLEIEEGLRFLALPIPTARFQSPVSQTSRLEVLVPCQSLWHQLKLICRQPTSSSTLMLQI